MSDKDDDTNTNRLIHATSPYLLQHAHNPVDWWPWCDEALQLARAEDKPIFLSIGYSACHWCHVMAHESFEDPAIAALLNADFIAIKVDREERPDLDDVYMAATVAQNGSGGWPMSVFLTPELKPFYTGTYFPPTDRYGKPGFARLLRALADAWREKPEDMRNTAESMCEYLKEVSAPSANTDSPITDTLLARASASLKQRFDEAHGGWGAAPKFPSSASILLLLREHNRTGDAELMQMARHTLDCMADGGIHDHIGGGFHRYSVDELWLVPHFEKMLYDNAQLAVAYCEAYQATQDARYKRVAKDVLEYLLRDMRHPEGAFYSAEDADSEGEEGKFYIWAKDEIDTLLGEDAAFFCEHYNIVAGGNFPSPEHYHARLNIPHIMKPPTDEEDRRLAVLREKLLAHRAKRVRPGLDDKILCSWNALTISAFATAAKVFGEACYRVAAEEAAAFIREHLYTDGALLRTHRNGKSHVPAYLDDHAFLCNALIDLYEATFNAEWLYWAEELSAKMLDSFWEEGEGCFYFSATTHKDLIVRPRPSQDGAEPAASSVAALAMIRLSRHLDRNDLRDTAGRAFRSNLTLAQQYPQAAINLLLAVSHYLHPGFEIVLIGSDESKAYNEMLRSIHKRYLPNIILAGGGAAELPLLKGRKPINGKPTVYICQGQQCSAPITDLAVLEAALL